MSVAILQERFSKVFDPRQATVLAEVIHDAYSDLVKTSDFNELKEIVRRLGQAQERLAETQQRSEQKLVELAEAQQRTEQKVSELAEAQKNTQIELRTLVREHDKTRKELGGLSTSFGYRLENEAYKALPALLSKDYGIELKTRLIRDYLQDKTGNFLEVNILGLAERAGEKLLIVGEAKSQLSKKFVDEFIRKKLDRLPEGQKVFPVLVTHMIAAPEVKDYVQEKGIALYYSYDF
jgi:chromosome segregation ATPase